MLLKVGLLKLLTRALWFTSFTFSGVILDNLIRRNHPTFIRPPLSPKRYFWHLEHLIPFAELEFSRVQLVLQFIAFHLQLP